MIYRTLQVPAKGAFGPPPNTPGPSFSSGRKGCKRPFKRDFVPLKDSPVGEPSGRVPHTPTAGFLSGNSRCSESALAFFAGRTLPISALYQVRASRPSLRGLARANYARSSAALWNFVPTLGLCGSSGSEMPSHFRKSARLRRAQRAALCVALSGIHSGKHWAVRPLAWLHPCPVKAK